MNTIIEKIRAEVERRKKQMVDASFPPVIKKTRISELSIVLDILDDIQERTDNPITFTLQEPVCDGLEEEFNEQWGSYTHDGSSAGISREEFMDIAHHFYELGRQSKGTEWTERDIENGSYISAFLQANCGDNAVLKRATIWFMSRLKQLPIQQSKPKVCEELEEAAKMTYPNEEGDLYSLHSTLQRAAFKVGAKWGAEHLKK